ncbi:MAG TPA: hypothetical protein VGN82_14095 [Bosea sp. (in: a-proteobacteria)]|jgi:hypothetical protein|uniref:hypothetical protein n=1 Tax=Bosea sp. (in: a-proteobacteria) TaxID=1871050 RepID=UPI002E107B48|nr:hypothetical protein [Bosea sp. (in: a-proteobacteria)]
MSRKPVHTPFRFEVVGRFGDEAPRLISRHHRRGNADRRLLRLPLRPGETVEIYEDGELVQTVRTPSPGEHPEIPF